jgi:hypothetical protein
MAELLFLPKSLSLEDGRCLRTILDADEMIHGLSPQERGGLRWRLVAATLLVASTTRRFDHIRLAAINLERTLRTQPFGSVRIVEKKPSASSTSIRARVRKASIGRKPCRDAKV